MKFHRQPVATHSPASRVHTPEMTPIRSRLGGSFGQAVQVLISTLSTSREEVGKIHEELFGDCLPNYDSTFFREQDSGDGSNAT